MAKTSTRKAPAKPGRPSLYTEALAQEFCARIASGQYLHRVAEAEGMPDERTLYRWLDSNETFRQMYVRAREMRAERHAEYLLEISDDGRNDWMEQHNEDGDSIGWKLNGEHVQRSKLRVDARKWLMSKESSKYGDKISHEHTGKDGGPIEKITREMTAEEAARVYRERISRV